MPQGEDKALTISKPVSFLQIRSLISIHFRISAEYTRSHENVSSGLWWMKKSDITIVNRLLK